MESGVVGVKELQDGLFQIPEWGPPSKCVDMPYASSKA